MLEFLKTNLRTITIGLCVALLIAVIIAAAVIIMKRNSLSGDGGLIRVYNRIYRQVDNLRRNLSPASGTRGIPLLFLLQLSPYGRIIEEFPIYKIPPEGVTISRSKAEVSCPTDIVLKHTRASDTVSKDAAAICLDSKGFFLKRVESLNRIFVFDGGKLTELEDKCYAIPDGTEKLLFRIGAQYLMLQFSGMDFDSTDAGNIFGRAASKTGNPHNLIRPTRQKARKPAAQPKVNH